MKNAFQILSDPESDNMYNVFLNLVYLFPEFTYNQEKTFDQPGAEQGLQVDSLFDLRFPQLAFNICNERTHPPSGTFGLPANVTIRYHHWLIAPTNEAFEAFDQEYMEGPGRWGSLEEAPDFIKRIIVNTHMCANPIFPTDMQEGFYNGELDRVTTDQVSVLNKQFGSNCTFIGTDKVIIPRAFKSVTGPIYLQKGYSKVMYAIERAGLLPALKRENENYLFFVESDLNTTLDSSLVYYPSKTDQGRFSVFLITSNSFTEYSLGTNDLRTLLLNHIGSGYPTGIPRKEFIKNLAGNYIIINNETGEVSGTAATKQGYRGLETVINKPVPISTNADNGTTYDMGDWFNFSAITLFQTLSTNYGAFHNYLRKADLSEDRLGRYNFISENDNYTVFVPTAEALSRYRADTLTIPDLKKFLMLHFVQGELIFTDGKLPAGYYETTRIDEKSTEFSIVFSKIYLEPGIDVISLKNKTGGNYTSVNESPTANILAGRNLAQGIEIYPNLINNAVIHQIDTVLVFGALDTQ